MADDEYLIRVQNFRHRLGKKSDSPRAFASFNQLA
jgi:hypothetical protein